MWRVFWYVFWTGLCPDECDHGLPCLFSYDHYGTHETHCCSWGTSS